MSKTKRVRISNDRLNSYGTRVLTSGMDLEQYRRNPVLLYMHERGKVIGYVKDVAAKDGEVTGELVFDEATELSRQCKRQWEFGSLKMVSAGLDIIETSEAEELLVAGQTRATIVRSKLFEVSVVDIGANDDAIVLHKDGLRVAFGKAGESALPLLDGRGMATEETTPIYNNQKNVKEMDQEKLALELGLEKDADEGAILLAIGELKSKASLADDLHAENEKLKASHVGMLVDDAIAAKKIDAGRRGQFVDLGLLIGAEELSKTFSAMHPEVKLSSMLTGGGAAHGGAGDWQKLGDVPAGELLRLRSEDPARYKQLYKAEYGMECEL